MWQDLFKPGEGFTMLVMSLRKGANHFEFS